MCTEKELKEALRRTDRVLRDPSGKYIRDFTAWIGVDGHEIADLRVEHLYTSDKIAPILKDSTIPEDKLANELTEYVSAFIAQRFPDGLSGDIEMVMKEIIFDAFNEGAHWAEFQHVGERKGRIIMAAGGNA